MSTMISPEQMMQNMIQMPNMAPVMEIPQMVPVMEMAPVQEMAPVMEIPQMAPVQETNIGTQLNLQNGPWYLFLYSLILI